MARRTPFSKAMVEIMMADESRSFLSANSLRSRQLNSMLLPRIQRVGRRRCGNDPMVKGMNIPSLLQLCSKSLMYTYATHACVTVNPQCRGLPIDWLLIKRSDRLVNLGCPWSFKVRRKYEFIVASFQWLFLVIRTRWVPHYSLVACATCCERQ